MTFDPRFLPARTRNAYMLGVGAWPLVVRTAMENGIRDIDCLTDIVFYLNHPELGGCPLSSAETALIDHWKRLRRSIVLLVPLNPGGWDPVKKDKITGRSTTVETRVHGWDKFQEIRSGSTSHMRAWRSRNGHLFHANASDPQMWSWHEAALIGEFDPRFLGGVFVAS